MADPVRFGRGQAPDEGRGLLGLAALFLLVSIALFSRPLWSPSAQGGVIVEVRGDVTAPGTYRVDPPTARAAVDAAGGPSSGIPDTRVVDGDAVVVGPGGIRVVPMGDPLLVLLPVDVNTADAAALAALPGVGKDLAARIVEERLAHGPFAGLDGLTRVGGVGDATVVALAPYTTASGPPPGPIDLNQADVQVLQRLDGIGPALAARIVASRVADGPFRTVDDLQRVSGIGPTRVAQLADSVVVGVPEAP